jgi:hypothetical protein
MKIGGVMEIRAMAAAIVVAAALTVSGCGMATAQVQSGPQPPGGPSPQPPGPRMGAGTISVTGVGRASVRPDVGIAMLGAEMRAPLLADATADVSRRMTEVLGRVKALGVADRDITTVTYVVEPVFSPRRTEDDQARVIGYRVANIVQVKIRDIAAVGRVLDAAVAGGANAIRSVQFSVDDPSRAEEEARAQAVKNAATRARQLAVAAGVRLGELLQINEGAPGPRPVFERFGRATLAAAPMAPGPVETGEQEIVVTVDAHYRIER